MIGTEHKDLLAVLIDAVRAHSPRRQPFMCVEGRGGTVHLVHRGLKDGGHFAYPADLETLEELGAIRIHGREPYGSVEVTPNGLSIYSDWQQEAGAANAVIELERQYIDSAGFRARHPEAYDKWRAAVDLLWANDSKQHATSIGHLCREAHQLVITSLVSVAGHTPTVNDVQKTKSRLKEVLVARCPSDSIIDVIEAAQAYFGAVADLAQRQEHGTQRDKGPLTWEDSKRLVLHTLVIMTELDRLVAMSA